MASQELSLASINSSIYRIPSDASNIQPYYISSVIQASFEPANPSSIADSDSVASFSESDQGSQQSDHQSTSSWKSSKSRGNNNNTVNKEVRAVHNVSEQHRRKYLKSCFDNLQREVVSESSAKVSHLVILTSALEAITSVRHQESNIRREQERINLEFRQLKDKFDDVIKDLVQADPNFDVHQVLNQCGLGPVDTFSPTFFERLDRFLIEDSQEITSVSALRDFSEDIESASAKRPVKMSPAISSPKKSSKKAKIKSGDVSSGASVESLDGDAEMKSEGDYPSVNGVTVKSDQPLFLRLIDDIEDSLAEDSSLPIQRKSVFLQEPMKPLSLAERRKLAAEKGLPLHLAAGIPTLPGGNYWSQSISAFPAFSSRFRSSFSRRRFSLMPTDSSKLPLSLRSSSRKHPIVRQDQSKAPSAKDSTVV